MARLDPEESFEALKSEVTKAIGESFPQEGRKHVIELKGVEVEDNVSTDDVTTQAKAKVGGKTFGVPVKAQLVLKDKETGKVVDERTMKVATLPKVTSRFSYIVDGSEYQVDNQWRLRPGVYTKVRQDGDLESFFNIEGRPLHMGFDPKTRKFHMQHGGAKPPLYPIMRALGHSDADLRKMWGEEILAANQVDTRGRPLKVERKAMEFAQRLDPQATVTGFADAAQVIKDSLDRGKLHPEVTQKTLGKPIASITPEAMALTSGRLLGIARGEQKPDVRDSLQFKELYGVEDFIGERIRKASRLSARKIANNIDRKTELKDIVGMDAYGRPIKEFFGKSALASTTPQTNPLRMISGQTRTTITGEGGIQEASRITEDAKLLDPSHFGVLDALHTPEGCFDDQTEVFTEDGWFYWDQVTPATRFACLIDGELEFHKADDLQRYHYRGTMYGFRKPSLEYLVTPNHRVWCRPMRFSHVGYRIVSAEEVHGKPRYFQGSHKPYRGVPHVAFALPFVRGNNSSKNVDTVPIVDFAELVGWYLSEGSCQYNEANSTYQVHLFQSEVNQKMCERIRNLLDRLPFTWSESSRENGRLKFTIATKQIAHFVYHILGSGVEEKRLPDFMLRWPLPARTALYEGLMLGDGRLAHEHRKRKQFSYVYTTTSTELARSVERLVISLGHGATVKQYSDKREERYRDVFEVRQLLHEEHSWQTSSRHRETPYYTREYNGEVFCATVPGSLLFVRRNSKYPLWMGNSKTGVSLQLSIGAKKEGRRVKVPLINVKTGKPEFVDTAVVNDSVVALPDSVKRTKDGRFVPREGSLVRSSVQDNEIKDVKMSEVQYVAPKAAQMFSLASNQVPFLSSDSPNRATMSGRHQEQAIPLKEREAPLVRSMLGDKSFDEIMGQFAAQHSPVDGEVISVKPDEMVIKTPTGKKRAVQLYNHYPTNDVKGQIHAEPTVKPGDKVKRGDLIADTNFTQGGMYAPGKNLTVAYTPWASRTFEDGVVISESAAKKLTSVHLHKKAVNARDATLESKKRYQTLFGGRVKKDQLEGLEDDGVVRVGQVVKPGDVLVAASADRELTTEQQKLRLLHKSLVNPKQDMSITWEENRPGKVVAVHHNKGKVEVHVETEEPMEVGDKLSARHASKGIVTAILPDHEMPQRREGDPVDIVMNPIGIAGRLNIGQVLETAASKVAEKTGKSFDVHNFEVENNHKFVKDALKENGLSDTEDLIDPKTGKPIKKILTGKQYFFKLEHQVGKKMSARDRGAYDYNQVPKGGGKEGAQAFGSLGLYAMLGHGARANLRESQTWLSDKSQGGPNDDLWGALQSGELLPPPKQTFAYTKFDSYLKAMGVNTEQDGNSLNLMPLTDKQVLELSAGELKNPGKMVIMKGGKMQPEKGGLFDKKVTGGLDGQSWGHLSLPTAMPNPLFEKAIKSLARIRGPEYGRLIDGELGVDDQGKIVPAGTKGASFGPRAVTKLIKGIDVDKELKFEEGRIGNLRDQLQDESRKRIKYLRTLKKLDMSPADAYTMKNVPVLPPSMRPIALMEDGTIQNDDLNQLYKNVGVINDRLKAMPADAPQSLKTDKEAHIYDHLKALTGLGGTLNDKHPGLMQIMAGKDGPKTSFAQSTLIKRKRDMTGRSTIVPNPSLSIDEAGIPRDMARKIYKPFVMQELRRSINVSPLDAKKMVEEDDPIARKALEKVVEDRPILLKRDPALHKFNVQAFKPRLVSGKAIQIPNLVCSGFNSDFDGDYQINSVFCVIPNSCYAADISFWKERSIAVGARFKEQVGFVDKEDHLVICDLEDFPHEEEKLTKEHIDFHPVPDGVRVVALDEKKGPVLAEVSGWSLHRKRRVEIVTLASGRQIITDDDERAVYGVDVSSLEWCRRRPSEAKNQFVPVLDHTPNIQSWRETIELGGSPRLKEQVLLDFRFGYFLGVLVGDGWAAHDRGEARSVNLAKTRDDVATHWKACCSSVFADWENETFTETWSTEGKLGNSKGSRRITVTCAELARRVDTWIGHGAENKHLPPFFYSAPKEFKQGLLSGLWDSDGSGSWSGAKKKEQFLFNYTSNSLRLVQEIQRLFHMWEVKATITATSTPKGVPSWLLNVSSVDLFEGRGLGISMAYSRYRLVPLPSALAKELRALMGSHQQLSKEMKSVYATISKAIDRQYVSHDVALKLLVYLSVQKKTCSHPLFNKWKQIVEMRGVHFERVKSVEVTGIEEDGYDLTVPGYETFMSTDGIILSNTMSAYVPVSEEAKQETYRMFPSNNLFSPATHKVVVTPSHEMQVGLYQATEVGKKTDKSFKTVAELKKAVGKGELEPKDIATVGGVKTTLRRMEMDQLLPKEMQGGKILKDLDYRLTKKDQGALFNQMARTDAKAYAKAVNEVKDLGNKVVNEEGFSMGLDDFAVHEDIRRPLLEAAKKKTRGLDLGTKEGEQKLVDVYEDVSTKMEAAVQEKAKKLAETSNLAKLQVAAGIKGNGYRQLTAMPGLFVDGKGDVVPSPVTRSYGEGLRSSDYWSSMSGGRKGIIQKVQSVSKPGYLTKMTTSSVIDTVVDTDDCGTKYGISLPVDEPDVQGRISAADVTLSTGEKIPAGTLLTGSVLNKIRNDKQAKVVVRSPMRCIHTNGICAKCMGLNENGELPEKGTNVGVLAAQALGERGTQLALKSFHSGGIYAGKQKEGDIAEGGIDRAFTLLDLPQKVKGSATLAETDGVVRKISDDPAGGLRVEIESSKRGARGGETRLHYVPSDRKLLGKTRVGTKVRVGDPISSGPVNPHEMLPLTGVNKVQGHLAQELHNIYGKEGIRRRNSEVLVRAITSVTKVNDPGDHPDLLPGDFAAAMDVADWNSKTKGKPVLHQPVVRGVRQIPTDVSEDWLARLNHERLKMTLVEGAQRGWSSDLHGRHPIPPLIQGLEFGKGTKKKPWLY